MKRFLYLFLALIAGSPASQAFELTINEDMEFGCLLEIEGELEVGVTAEVIELMAEIVESDTAEMSFQFKSPLYPQIEVIEDFSVHLFDDPPSDGLPFQISNGAGLSVCLSSPEGGDFAAGMNLYEFFKEAGLGTVVPPGASCVSACAVAFFGGTLTYFSPAGDTWTAPHRSLYTSSKLGVHAPSLDVLGATIPVAVLSETHDKTVRQTRRLFSIFRGRDQAILETILGTPASGMYYYDTVGKLLNIEGVVVHDTPSIDVPTDEEVHNACFNALAQYRMWPPEDIFRCSPGDWWDAETQQNVHRPQTQIGLNRTASMQVPNPFCFRGDVLTCEVEPGYNEKSGRWSISVGDKNYFYGNFVFYPRPLRTSELGSGSAQSHRSILEVLEPLDSRTSTASEPKGVTFFMREGGYLILENQEMRTRLTLDDSCSAVQTPHSGGEDIIGVFVAETELENDYSSLLIVNGERLLISQTVIKLIKESAEWCFSQG